MHMIERHEGDEREAPTAWHIYREREDEDEPPAPTPITSPPNGTPIADVSNVGLEIGAGFHRDGEFPKKSPHVHMNMAGYGCKYPGLLERNPCPRFVNPERCSGSARGKIIL